MEEGWRVGTHQDGFVGDGGERRNFAVGQRDDAGATGLGEFRSLDGVADIAIDRDGQQHIGFPNGAQHVDTAAARSINQHRIRAEQRTHVVKNIGDGKTRSQAQAKHPVRGCDHIGGGRESPDGVGRRQILQMLRQRGKDILHQR